MASDAALALPRPEPDDAEPRTPAVARSRTKRVLDLVGGLVLCTLTLPVAAVLALAVRLDSPGPVLYRQRRAGLGGRLFTLYKFRSMHDGCDEEPHRTYVTGLVTGERETSNGEGLERTYKLIGDPRVTRMGKWLRRTSLDELPQLLNVVRGEMSLVGPRPALPYEVEHYDEIQRRRLDCRPGLSGLWQVSGRNRLSYRGMVDLDLEYIREWSLWLDLKILLRTIPVVLKNSGKAQ